MSGLNYLKLGSTLSDICNTTNLTTPLNATTPSKISGENPVYLWKTLKEKEKLLVTSNFFSHNVFYPM